MSDLVQKWGKTVKTAGWAISPLRPGKPVSERVIMNLIKKEFDWPYVKGSLEWFKQPEFSKLDYSVSWGFRFKIRDPETGEEADFWGQVKAGFQPSSNPIPELWVGIHI